MADENPVEYMIENMVQCQDELCFYFKQNKTISTDVSPKEDFDFSQALENVYPLVDIICSYLPYRELMAMSKISETWEEAAQKELSRRKYEGWLMLCKQSNVMETHYSRNYNYSQKHLTMVFYNYKQILMNSYVCIHRSEEVQRKIFYEHLVNDVIDMNSMDFICISLKSLYSFYTQDINLKPLYSCFTLPDIPGIRIQQIHYSRRNKNSLQGIKKENERVECLLVFGMASPVKALCRMLEEVEKNQKGDLTIGGGLVWGLKYSSNKFPRAFYATDLFSVAFLSDKTKKPNFFSDAIVIPQFTFDQAIERFKDRVVMRKQSVMFRFCCIGKSGMEAEEPILRRLFPTTTLVQLDVNGEIGYAEQMLDNPPATKKSKDRPKLFHQFSTVLVFISWGELI